jgi:acyl dehydratase
LLNVLVFTNVSLVLVNYGLNIVVFKPVVYYGTTITFYVVYNKDFLSYSLRSAPFTKTLALLLIV